MKKFLLYFFIVFILIQFIQADKTNPIADSENEIKVNQDVKNILKRACYDCHSNETKWPSYSYVAPVSWAISSHIKKGRVALNFSEWKVMDENIKNLRIERMDRVILNGMMPKGIYTSFHPESKLTKEDKDKLVEWVKKDLRENK